MNQKEFFEYANRHLPPTLGKVTLEGLKRYDDFGVLRPHPEYYARDLHILMGLMKMEQSFQKQALKQGIELGKPTLPYPASGTIYQVLSFLREATSEAEMKEKAIVRLALVNSGLISTLGFVYINFSPLTGNTLESLLAIPAYKSRFEKAAASKELLIIQDAIQFVESGTEKEMLTTLTPVLFIQGVKPTVVYSTFIFGGYGRLVGPQQYVPLPRPLYEEFLDLDVQSLDDVLNFMATHLMIGSFGARPDQDEIDFIKITQEKMRQVLMRGTKGRLGVADLSPLSPFHEDDVIEAKTVGKMGGIDIFTAEGKPVSVGEIKATPAYKWEGHEWVPYNQSKLHISRYYNWLDFMWAELIKTVTSGSQTPVCLRCGKLLPQKRGRRKTYCGPENPKCYRARKAEYVRRTRSKDRMM
jgi:hypothetical protein